MYLLRHPVLFACGSLIIIWALICVTANETNDKETDYTLDREDSVIYPPELQFEDEDESFPVEPTAPTYFKSQPSCFPNEVLLVSTMDGKISALDLENLDTVLWSVNTGSTSSHAEPLLSSSVNEIKTKEGSWFVPSLDGILYRFSTDLNESGETHLKSNAISAEELLDKSLVLAGGDLVAAGSKDITLIGINARTGLVCYQCNGGPHVVACTGDRKISEFSDCQLKDTDNIIIVRRVSHTVRAITTRTGEQQWNYSVAQNDLTFGGIKNKQSSAVSKEDVIITTCSNSKASDSALPVSNLKFHVLEGRITYNEQKFDFKVPIAQAWTVTNGKLQSVNLFDPEIIEADYQNAQSQFLTFLGCFENQYYLQQSNGIHDLVQLRSKKLPHLELSWTPLPSTTGDFLQPSAKKGKSTVLYPLAKHSPLVVPGSYLLPSNQRRLQIDWSKATGASKVRRQFLKVLELCDANPLLATATGVIGSTFAAFIMMHSIWWWRQRQDSKLIEVTTPLKTVPSMNDSGFDSKSSFRLSHSKSDNHLFSSHSLPILAELDSPPSSLPSLPQPLQSSPTFLDFESRFYQDFEPLKCLGKGGFGVVFEARNKLDDCSYAIKRIALKNKTESKERVMREVKALAKLDHHGIVRYYQAWFESPPLGWNDPFLSHISNLSTDLFTTTSSDMKHLLPSLREAVEEQQEMGQGDSKQEPAKSKRYESSTTNNLMFNNNTQHSADGDSSKSSLAIDCYSESSGGISFRELGDSASAALLQNNSKFFSRSNSQPSSDSTTLNRISSESDSKHRTQVMIPEESFDIVFEHSMETADCDIKELNKGKADLYYSKPVDDDFIDNSESGPRGFFPIITPPSPHKRTESAAVDKDQIPTSGGAVTKAEKLFFYIQMQLCKKDTLKDWLRANIDRSHLYVLEIFGQLIETVHFLHSQGLIHRDLKPSNIFFSASDGTIKIGDFGLVTALVLDDEVVDQLTQNSPTDSKPLNQHTDQVGTKLYMSPEQVSGLSYGQKVDIYSLGIILFELLHPFNTEMERGHILNALRQDSVIPLTLRHSRKKETDLVTQMIHHDPSMRPTAEQLKETIEDYSEDLEEQLGPEAWNNDVAAYQSEMVRRRRRKTSFSRSSFNESNKSSLDSISDSEVGVTSARNDEANFKSAENELSAATVKTLIHCLKHDDSIAVVGQRPDA